MTSNIDSAQLRVQAYRGDELLSKELDPSNLELLPNIKEAFKAHLTFMQLGQTDLHSADKIPRYISVLHDTHNMKWQDIGLIVVERRVYDLTFKIIDDHLSKAEDANAREVVLHCIPIQCFADKKYDDVVPYLHRMNKYPGDRTYFFKHAIILITCVAQRENQHELINRLVQNSFVDPCPCSH